MADFGKINPEKAKAIINALKDGKINQNELKQLGLTEAEAQELTKAFSSGQVEIGDFVLINKGQIEKGGKKIQLSSTQKKEKTFELKFGMSQAEIDAERARLEKSMADNKRKGGVTGYLAGLYDAYKLEKLPKKAGIQQAGAGGVVKGLTLAAIAVISFIRCTPENKVEANQNQTMNLKLQDYSKKLDQIIERLDKIDNSIANEYKVLIGELQTIIQNQYATKETMEFQLNNLMNKMKDWFEKIVNNQVAIRTDNNKNAADILAAIKAIIDNKGDADAKLDELIKLLNQIKTVTGDIKDDTNEIKDTTNSILEEIKKAKDELKATLNTNNKAVLDAIAKLNDNDQKTLSVLNDIKALIKTYGDAGKGLGEQILVAIGNISGNVDLSEVLKLLEKLVNGQKKTNDSIENMTNIVSEFKAKNQEQLDVIISKLDKINGTLEKLGTDVTFGMNAILNAIKDLPKASDFNAKLDAIIERMDNLIGKTTKNGNTLVDILNAMKELQNTINIVIEGDKIKVICNCGNCGGSKHEGIIGDLNDLLG